MRTRVSHLVWLLVLLSSVSAADAAVRSATAHAVGNAHYARVLLGERIASAFRAPHQPGSARSVALAHLAAGHAAWDMVWAVRPPLAHVLSLIATQTLAS